MEYVGYTHPATNAFYGLRLVHLLGIIAHKICVSIEYFFTKYHNYDKSSYLGHEVVLADHTVNPFTFFNYIFVSKDAYLQGKVEEELLLHEVAHKKQLHSLDVVFMELLQIFFWY